MSERDYEGLVQRVAPHGGRAERMRHVVDLLWDNLSGAGVSWVGFYLPDGPEALVLGPARNKPACSPIGLHGACGRTFISKQPLVVRDVKELGENYIACDPRDQSEVVLPLLEEDGSCWAVLDVDSHDVGAFSEADVRGLQQVLSAAGLISA